MGTAVLNPKTVVALLDRYKVTSGKGFTLDDFATDDLPAKAPSKRDAIAVLAGTIARMAALQELLYANADWSLLVVIQAMDAGGKDSTIKHVMTGINPQGVRVTSFKAPEPRELARGFLWRVSRALPARGMIGIFNRSHYEDVLISRVHPAMVQAANLPAAVRDGDDFWDDRIADIAAFEAYLGRQGTKVIKLFLNVGRDEQRKRFLSRLDEPEKTWKFSAADVSERACWPKYRDAYQAAIAGTATVAAPWYIIPADRKWYTRLLVAEAMITALSDLGQTPPAVVEDKRRSLAAARKTLEMDQ